ncbi:glycosyltransferase family 4 protein [Pseudorhizobium marinum]|uniref:glycosyltransferase family 4 protein n=1 Tax=Pseudorhizobium marinum TaxID=1496690 RepID=UPI000495BE32|nr:glycosyltransferase family 4 protein [Pseudorhizobium marinum]
MRLLFCCEFYLPSVGGVQEVMRQIAERLVQRGHDVTVATTRLGDRTFTEHNGVKIAEFGVTGNIVRGMEGEVERYRQFVRSFECDAILIKAAQQWTFDALWPDLDEISARKMFIPCGFSGLFEPSYSDYFEAMPDVLRKFDHLVFYAESYRDTDFARRNGISQFSILPNGASEIEFGVSRDATFRQRNSIPEDSFVLLTVGSLTGVKGHRELLEAFVRLKTNSRHVTFIMNGNPPPQPVVVKQGSTSDGQNTPPEAGQAPSLCPPVWTRATDVFRVEGFRGIGSRLLGRLHHWSRRAARFRRLGESVQRVWIEEGWIGIRMRLLQRIGPRLERAGLLRYLSPSAREYANPLAYWMAEAQAQSTAKRLIVANYSRDELVQAYMAADLFVFASNIEYSPLVLFETVAAGTPFLSVPVGNAEEIARWTGGGIICPAAKDERGYTRVSPAVLAREIAKSIEDPEKLDLLGAAGHAAWKERFTWDAIATRYEVLLRGAGEAHEKVY